MNTNTQQHAQEAIKYVLYARKSSESEERQILSIESQVKEMLELAEREKLEVVAIRRESHSAKDTGQREVYNELIRDIRSGKFTGIITWAPDRLSRNAGDLGVIVDMMDQGYLREIRTHGQTFTNSPNEKFLLMILGSQAKLENDHRGVNVKRGLKTRVEMGLWPGMAPIGYLDQKEMDKKGQKLLDLERAPIIKQMFEKVAYDKYSGRKVYHWLLHELNFKTKGNKTLSLSGVHRVLGNTFYYGKFEYPKDSGKWYDGKHKPIITQELFEKAREQLQRDNIVVVNKEFAFTKLMTCGMCGSGVCAQEKFKQLKDGTHAKYIYYGCSRGKDRHCKNRYIREEELIAQLIKIVDKMDIDALGIRCRLEDELKRFSKFQRIILGSSNEVTPGNQESINIREYAKYLLREGSITEKRFLLGNLKSKLVYKNKRVELLAQDE